MASAPHSYEDKLLDYAYGELPETEASSVRSHVESCPTCKAALAHIETVRTAMKTMPMEPAPDAGLESLLAYADQAARRSAAGSGRARAGWRRWLGPMTAISAVASVAAVVVLVGGNAKNLAPAASDALSGQPSNELAAPRDADARAAQGFNNKQIRNFAPSPRPETADDLGAPPELSTRREQKARADKAMADSKENAVAGLRASPMAPAEADEASSAVRGEGASLSGKMAAKDARPPAPSPASPSVTEAEAKVAKYAEPSRAAQNLADYGRSASNGSGAAQSERLAEKPSTLSLGAKAGPVPAAAAPPPPVAQATLEAAAPAAKAVGAATAQALAPDETPARQVALARDARKQGDRDAEVEHAQRALVLGATGETRQAALAALCVALDDLGRVSEADKACASLMAEFPSSPEARVASHRTSPASSSGTSRLRAVDSSDAPMPAAKKKVAPADTLPASPMPSQAK